MKFEAAKDYILHKAGALKQQNGKYRAVQSARLQRKLVRSFTKQRNWLIQEIEKLSFFKNTEKVIRLERKTTRREIDDMLDDMPEQDSIADNVSTSAGGAYKKGAKASYDQFSMDKFAIKFDLINDYAIDYLENKRKLHLSDFKGSINRTTKRSIQKILLDAAESGQSYQDTARQIMTQSSEGAFSYARAEMIAVNEIGHGYGNGNREMVKIYTRETGAIIQKSWITVEDDRVTPECHANQEMGWIGFNESFDSGDQQAPRASNPRCRCDCGYRHVDTQGNEL